jgi:S1-C subfamily serine protease
MKKYIYILMVGLFAFAILLNGNIYAKIYKYQDENGNWRFTDSPVTAEEAGASLGDTDAGEAPSLDLATRLMKKKSPKNQIERAAMATVGIKSPTGAGSGFFVTNDGYIITNRHVVKLDEDQAKQVEQEIQQLEIDIQRGKTLLKSEERKLEVADRQLQEFQDAIYNSALDEHKRKTAEADYIILLAAMGKHKEACREYEEDLITLESKIGTLKHQMNSEYYSSHFTIVMADGTELIASVVSTSKNHDLALLKLEGYDTPYIETLNSNALAQGDSVYAIGNPIGLKNSVAAGVLSGHESGYVKTDAKIYPGNSGGPLVSAGGQVIGINTLKLLTRNFEGLGFAIPIETALAEFYEYL